jgi:ribosome assembly protein 1
MKKIFSLDEQKKGNIFADKYNQERIEFMQELFEKLKEHNTDENVINLLKDNMVCFGPNYIGSNLLVFKNMDTKFSLYNKIMDKNEEQLPNHTCLKLGEDVLKILEEYKLTIAELENSIRLGFDIACTSGPLCNEPMVGVIFILEDIIKADVVQPQPKA